MRKVVFILLALLIAGGLGLGFGNSRATKHDSVAFNFGWVHGSSCSGNGIHSCALQNNCITPLASPTKGIPLRYTRTAPATCVPERNDVALVADVVLYLIVGLLISAMITGIVLRFVKKEYA